MMDEARPSQLYGQRTYIYLPPPWPYLHTHTQARAKAGQGRAQQDRPAPSYLLYAAATIIMPAAPAAASSPSRGGGSPKGPVTDFKLLSGEKLRLCVSPNPTPIMRVAVCVLCMGVW